MRSSRILTCFTLLLVLSCLLLAAAAFGISQLNRRVVANFGEPAPGLSLRSRIFLQAILFLNRDQLTQPFHPFSEDQSFTIQPGESVPNILGRLWESGLIGDPAALRAYLQYSGLDTGLQAGDYSLNASMSAIEVAQALQDATPASVEFNILPGWRLEEIAEAMPTSGLEITPEAFLQAASEVPAQHRLAEEIPLNASVEGFMFPGTYEIPRETTAPELVYLFLDRFQENITSEILDGFDHQGLSLYEAVTLASIVERESVIDSEKPLVASVFLNRLASGTKLDADSTVQYALGYREGRGGWWTNPLTYNDLEVNSLYNTYQFSGLPPGPISNPSLDSLRAVAFPAQTPYFYFQAACDGSGRHVFAETYQEHLNNSCP
jgi:UPF0755 protein